MIEYGANLGAKGRRQYDLIRLIDEFIVHLLPFIIYSSQSANT